MLQGQPEHYGNVPQTFSQIELLKLQVFLFSRIVKDDLEFFNRGHCATTYSWLSGWLLKQQSPQFNSSTCFNYVQLLFRLFGHHHNHLLFFSQGLNRKTLLHPVTSCYILLHPVDPHSPEASDLTEGLA